MKDIILNRNGDSHPGYILEYRTYLWISCIMNVFIEETQEVLSYFTWEKSESNKNDISISL